MINKCGHSEKISHYFSLLAKYVEFENEEGDFKINKYCEDFFSGILNKVYKLNLVNLNLIKVNFPAADIGDIEESICFQVTSNVNADKIKHTLEMYEKYKIYDDYEKIKIIGIVKNSNSKTGSISNENYEFSYTDDVIDLFKLKKDIMQLSNKRREKIIRYIEENMNLETGEPSFFRLIDKRNYVLPKNLEGYRQHYGLTDDMDFNEIVISYKKFIEEIASLDEGTRAVIAAIITRRIDTKDDDILFDEAEIYPYFKTNRNLVNEKLRILLNRGWIHERGTTYEDYNCLNYNDTNGINLFYDLSEYCVAKSIDVNRVFESMDFTFLSE